MEAWREGWDLIWLDTFHSGDWGKCQLKTIIAIVVMLMFPMFFLQMDHSYQSFNKEMAAFTSGPSRLPESTTRGDQNVRQCTLWILTAAYLTLRITGWISCLPSAPVLSVCQRGQYHSGRFLLCKSTGFTRSGDKAILWVLLARLQVMHLWLNHSGSDQSVSYEDPLATAGVV